MLLTSNNFQDIESKSVTKHFLIQEICFIIGILIIMNFGIDKIIYNYRNLQILEAHRGLINIISLVSSIISPIINMIVTSIVFDLVLSLSKINIEFKTIFKISCIANYINLINVLLNLIKIIHNYQFIEIIVKFNIVNVLYLIVIILMLLRFLESKKIHINKNEKVILFVIPGLTLLFSVFIKI